MWCDAIYVYLKTCKTILYIEDKNGKTKNEDENARFNKMAS